MIEVKIRGQSAEEIAWHMRNYVDGLRPDFAALTPRTLPQPVPVATPAPITVPTAAPKEAQE